MNQAPERQVRIHSLIAALLLTVQAPAITPPAPSDGKPVHVWLDAAGPLVRGSSVRVYVRTAVNGNLVVLQRRTDGRIQVLFPAAPTDDPRVRAGSYEIRGPGDRAALTIAEPDGAGMILAAVSSDPIWFDEFARAASWNPDALRPSWSGADAEGALGDIVQRMLGDGTFNYDIVTYIVAPAVVAQAPEVSPPSSADAPTQYEMTTPSPAASIGTCIGCTVVGSEVVILETPLFFGRGRRFRERRPVVEPECHAGQQCDHHVQSATTAPLLAAQHAVVVPSRSELAARRRFTPTDGAPSREPSSTSVEPRRRELPSAAGTVALLPGRMSQAVRSSSRVLAGAAPEARSALAARYVRFHPVAPGGAEPPPAPILISTPSSGTAVPAPAPDPGRRIPGGGGAVMMSTVVAQPSGTAPVLPMGRRAWSGGVAAAASAVAPSPGVSATATTTGSGSATAGSQTMALPMGAWRATARPRVRH